MRNLKLGFKIFFLILLGVASSFLLVAKKQYNDRQVSSAAFDSVTVAPSAGSPEQVETEKMDSPDGSKTLAMKKQPEENRITYSLITSDASGENELSVYIKEEELNSRLEIPYNTWSPDNIYFFLKETTPESRDYSVFFASGESFPDDLQYLKIRGLFLAKYPDYLIEDVTGWASTTMLLVNATSPEGQKISFWFDVPSQSFTQLGTYFR